MLQNKRYIGVYTYKGTEIAGGMPRIVSDDLFYKVQGIIGLNKKAPARSKADQAYLLTTKLFCGNCGEMMTGDKGTSQTGKAYYYYKCNNAKKRLCAKKAIKKDFIENLVITECRKLLTSANIEKIAHEVVSLCEREKGNANLKRFEKLLRDNERRRGNMLNAVSECDLENIRKSMYVEMAKLSREHDEIEHELAQERASMVILTNAEVKFFLSQLKNGKVDEVSYRKTLINVFVNSIYLYDGKMTIIFNSGDKPVTVSDDLLNEICENTEFVFETGCSTTN